MAALRWCYVGALLLAPAGDPTVRRFCRLLGLRHLAEAAFLHHPTRARCLPGAGVDGGHAASALWLARRHPEHARGMHANAVTAAALTSAGAWRAALAPA